MSFSYIKLISKAFTLFRRFGNVVNHAFLVLISMSNILLVLLFSLFATMGMGLMEVGMEGVEILVSATLKRSKRREKHGRQQQLSKSTEIIFSKECSP